MIFQVHSKFELTDHAQLISSLKELMESKKWVKLLDIIISLSSHERVWLINN